MPIDKQKRIFYKLISFTEEEGKRAYFGFFMGSAGRKKARGFGEEYMFRSASTLAHAHRHFPVLLCHSFETEFLHT